MPSKPLRIADRVLLVVVANGAKAVVDLCVGIALARLLAQSDFGSYRQFLLIYGTLIGLTSLGLPHSLLYFVPKRRANDAAHYVRRVFTIILSVSLPAILLVAALSEPIARVFNNPDLPALIRIGMIYALGQVLAQCLPSLLISIERHRQAALAIVLTTLLNAGSILVPVALGYSLERVVASMGVASVLILFMTLAMARHHMRALGQARGTSVGRELLGYATPLALNSMIGTFNQKMDRFLISFFFNPAVLAVYSVGAMELPFVPILPYTIGRVLIPRFVELEHAGDRGEILRVWHRATMKVALVQLPIFCLGFAMAPHLIVALYGADYAPAAFIFRIYLLLLPLRVTSYGAVLQALGEPRTVLRGSVLTLALGPPMGVALLWALGWYGPAIAAVALQFILIVYLLRKIRERLEVSWREVWPWRKSLRLVAAAFLASAAGLVVSRFMPELPVAFVAGGLVYIVVYAGLAFRMGLLERDDVLLARRWLTLRVFL